MTQSHLNGSCLCGAVRYEIDGEVKRFYHCHCRRCRKASGTGHASNLMVAAESMRWLSGEALISSYKVPDAERFTSRFCSVCGSQVPRVVKEIGMVVIPAGSLDSEVTQLPEARIFCASRASWSCRGDALPEFDEYPV